MVEPETRRKGSNPTSCKFVDVHKNIDTSANKNTFHIFPADNTPPTPLFPPSKSNTTARAEGGGRGCPHQHLG